MNTEEMMNGQVEETVQPAPEVEEVPVEGAAAPEVEMPATPVTQTPSVYCSACGTACEIGAAFCPECGTAIAPAPIQQMGMNYEQPKKGHKKIVIGAIAGIVALILIVMISSFASSNSEKNALQSRLMGGNWGYYDDPLILYLDFSTNNIEYSAYGSYIGTNVLANLSYEVVDGDTIKVNGREISVEFEDKGVIFRPSFVDSESYSLWIDINLLD